VDISLTAVEINNHEMLLDDATGQYVEKPTSGNPWVVQLKNGGSVRVPAANNVVISNLSHNWEPIGDEYNYHFKIDTTDNPYIMRLGLIEDEITPLGEMPKATKPEGWLSMGVGWVNLYGKATLSETSEFSIQSKMRPGLQAMFIMSHDAKAPLPSFNDTDSNVRVAGVANIFVNSLRKFVIGPAIDPEITQEGMKALIGRWVYDYGFDFLAPLLKEEGAKTLDEIATSDPFEQEILDCLKKFEFKKSAGESIR